jgi:hypothetical protein
MKSQQFKLTYYPTTGSSEDETLTINPDGWADNGQSWQRDRIYHGVFQSYTVESFRFARKSGGGGDFIYEKYSLDDLKTNIQVEVSDLNPQTNGYEVSYTGKLNFDPDKINITRDYFEIGFVQSGILQNMITRDEIEVDISQNVSLDGVTMNEFSSSPKLIAFNPINIARSFILNGNFNYAFRIGNSTPSSIYFNPGTTIESKYQAEQIITSNIGDALIVSQEDPQADRSKYWYENTADEGNFSVKFKDPIVSSDSVLLRFEKDNTSLPANASVTIKVVLTIAPAVGTPTTRDIFTKTVTRNPADSWPYDEYVEFDFSDLVDEAPTLIPETQLGLNIEILGDNAFWDNTTMRYFGSLVVRFDMYDISPGATATKVTSYHPYEAFTRILQLITSEESTFYSEYFGRTDSEFETYSATLGTGINGKNDAITTGWNLRRYPDRPFTVNLRQLFQTFDSIYNLGFSYDTENERFYIERKEEFYQIDTLLFDLGEVSNLVIKPYKEAYINDYSAGYDNDGKYEELQGVNEINVKSKWSSFVPVKETLSATRGRYNTDSLGMEFSRRKDYTLYSSEDTDYDNNIYIARTEYSGGQWQTKQGLDTVTGFDGIDEYYNLEITPRENMIRWGNLIKCGLWKETSFDIRFQKSVKTININYENQNGDTVNEFDNIESTELTDDRLFNPQLYSFDSTFDLTKLATLKSNPHGYITFTFEGVGYAGFIDEIQTEDYNRKAKYTLIAIESTQNVRKAFADGDLADFANGDDHLFT